MERVNEFRSYKSSDNEIEYLKIQLLAGFFFAYFLINFKIKTKLLGKELRFIQKLLNSLDKERL